MGIETPKPHPFDEVIRPTYQVCDVESHTVIASFRTEEEARKYIARNAMDGAKWMSDNTYEFGTEEYATFRAMIYNSLMETFYIRKVHLEKDREV